MENRGPQDAGLSFEFTTFPQYPLSESVCTGNPTLASAGWLGASGFWLLFPTLASSMHRISCKYWPCFFDDKTSVYPQPHLHFSSYFWRISSGEANRLHPGQEHMSEWRHRPFRKGLDAGRTQHEISIVGWLWSTTLCPS